MHPNLQNGSQLLGNPRDNSGAFLKEMMHHLKLHMALEWKSVPEESDIKWEKVRNTLSKLFCLYFPLHVRARVVYDKNRSR